MTRKILYILSIAGLFLSVSLQAQDAQLKNKYEDKIRGARFIPYLNYPGAPFLNDKFLLGELEMLDGTTIKNIGLNYGCYRDELIYYNTDISTQIVVDKNSLKGFSFTDKRGIKRTFRRQSYNGSFKGDCFFEVLSDGDISLLSYRKVNLEASDTYDSKTGMSFQPAYTYFLYAADKGYIPLNMNRSSLLAKFNKQNQKLARKTLRKNGIIVSDEASFVQAWEVIYENGILPEFK